jgi:uncharacterized protein
MADVIFVHGAGPGGYEADAVLAADLADALGDGFVVRNPRLPEDGENEHLALDVLEAAIEHADRSAPLAVVGHSAGGYLVMKLLATRHPIADISAVCVVAAPFPGADADWTIPGFALPGDLSRRMPDGASVFLYASPDDEVVPFAHRNAYARALPTARVRTTTGGHQLGGDMSPIARDIRPG